MHRKPDALFLDAAGTFLLPSENVPDVYLRYARPHGVNRSPTEVLQGFRAAYNAPTAGPLRFTGTGHDFWRRVVFHSLQTDNESIFQAVYDYYARPEAWRLPPLLRESLRRVRAAGVPVCVISNFDTRLRPILRAMDLDGQFDEIIVSAEVGAEKPSRRIFDAACVAMGVDPTVNYVVHIGDDRRNDVWGARECGIQGWLWGYDVTSFEEIADRMVTGHMAI